jgi:prepilin-type N-terminal cleavage/methylation domain-containing protein
MNKSFTLVEVLAVIVIIGVLSSFIIINSRESSSQAEITRGKAFSLSLLTSLPGNFVSEWKFDGPTTAGSAATTNDAKDTWGANDAASVSGGLLVRDGVDCMSGKCLELDGADDFLTIPDNNSLDLPGNYTISFWAYNGIGTKTYPTFFNKAAQSSSNGFFWCFTGGTDEVNINYQWSTGSSYSGTTFNNVFSANGWTYLVFTFVNSTKTLKLYKNGLYTNDPKTLTSALPVDDGALYVGTYQGSATNYNFKGKIDEFRIFNEVLPVSQIEQDYYSGINKLLVNNDLNVLEYNQKLSELKINLTKHE